MPEWSITVEPNASAEDVARVARGLSEFNFARTGAQGRWITTLLRDGAQNVVGGAHGWTFGDCMHVDLLWVDEPFRGQGYGRRVLLATEQEGLARGCRNAVLSTFSFQARGVLREAGLPSLRPTGKRHRPAYLVLPPQRPFLKPAGRFPCC